MTTSNKSAEFDRFDSAVNKILTVSHAELQRREEKWKKQKAAKKRARKK